MTDKEILEQAIQKAIDGGWSASLTGDTLTTTTDGIETIFHLNHSMALPFIIFNHDFAKALWPDEPTYYLVCGKCDSTYNFWDKDKFDGEMPTMKYCHQCSEKLSKEIEHYTHTWQMHLRNMVASEMPVKYLGDNI